MRLIDADALIISDEECEGIMCRDCKMQVNGCADFYDIIKSAPTIEERKTGHWIDEESSPFYCSECGRYQYNNTLDIMQGDYKFCPYCGADMRGGNHENQGH